MNERKPFFALFCVILWCMVLTACGRGMTIALPDRADAGFIGRDEIAAAAFFDGHIRLAEEAEELLLPRGQEAYLGIIGRPYTEYYLGIMLFSGPSRARGLGLTESDGTGYAGWTWRVSENTRLGPVSAVITGGGDRKQLEIVIVE